jgi:DNA-binding NtrC family response regulator
MTRDDETTLGPSAARPKAPPMPTLRLLFAGGAPKGEVHALRPGQTPIGRGVDAVLGVRVEGDPRLSREHAVLSLSGDMLRIENKSKHGTLRNGVAVEVAFLDDGDVVQVGDTFFLVRMVPSDVVDVAVPSIVGVSPAAARLRATVRLVAKTNAAVLLLGPTGAGKDVVARAIHEESARRGAFVPVNTTAIPESLAESQLFGHVAGSFTGAKADHAGWFRDADHGTLFLDEVGDIPASLQPKLLRVLDDKKVTPVGASQAVHVDVRVIAATNADLDAKVRSNSFRADLHARLAEIVVHLPPLSARKEDVLPLFEHALPKGHAPLEPALVAALLAHGWPYNVREVMKLATELSVRGQGKPMLTLDLVEDRLRAPARAPSLTAPGAAATAATGDDEGGAQVPVPSKAELELLLKQHNGVIAEVARATGRSRKQVYRWLEKHGLRGDD